MILNFLSSCLYLLNAGNIGMGHFIQFLQCRGLNLELWTWRAGTLTTRLHPSHVVLFHVSTVMLYLNGSGVRIEQGKQMSCFLSFYWYCLFIYPIYPSICFLAYLFVYETGSHVAQTDSPPTHNRVSLCSPNCPRTSSVDQAGWIYRDLSVSASQVLGLNGTELVGYHYWLDRLFF